MRAPRVIGEHDLACAPEEGVDPPRRAALRAILGKARHGAIEGCHGAKQWHAVCELRANRVQDEDRGCVCFRLLFRSPQGEACDRLHALAEGLDGAEQVDGKLQLFVRQSSVCEELNESLDTDLTGPVRVHIAEELRKLLVGHRLRHVQLFEQPLDFFLRHATTAVDVDVVEGQLQVIARANILEAWPHEQAQLVKGDRPVVIIVHRLHHILDLLSGGAVPEFAEQFAELIDVYGARAVRICQSKELFEHFELVRLYRDLLGVLAIR